MNRLMAGASLLALIAASGAARAADADADAAAAADSGATVSEVIVTGTRQTGIKAADSAAPIQIVGKQQLLRTGATDLAQSLLSSVPSLNVQANGGDAAAIQVIAALRGLSPNDTLILVDGKRRHTTSNLAIDTGSPYTGSATTDLSFIPVAAIDHVEVLTDGAAAQYGSDAIAGVVNIILKKSSSGGTLTGTGGEYYNGQGPAFDFQLNHGFNVYDKGFVDITFEQRLHDFSTLGIGDNRITDRNGVLLPGLTPPTSNAVNANPAFPYINRLNGDPEFKLYTGFLNAGYSITNDIEAYAFGNYSYRTAQHYENYRVPTKVQGVTSTGDIVFPLPSGFDPREKFQEKDYSFTGGFRGTFMDWHWDLSSTYGGNNTQIYVVNSANAQLFPVLQAQSATPIVPQTNFYNGAFDATQWTSNIDVSNSFDVGLAAPLSVAIGGEYRRETFGISQGEPSSYFGAGAQSFDGYTPLDQGDFSRNSGGVYIDLATDPIKGLHVDLAGRFESYSDFGETEVGKITVRYDFNSMLAIRGTVSSGFRAPTLAEERYSGTNVSPTSADVVLPANSAPALLAGFGPLKPELSNNYSIGFVAHPLPNLQLTADYYNILIRDRILESGFLYGTCCSFNPGATPPVFPQVISQGVLNAIAAKGVSLDQGLSYTGISLFANAANTRTQGVEVTANYATDFGDYGHVDWSIGFNYNQTDITHVIPLPTQVLNVAFGQTAFLTPNASSALTTATPREKAILQANWSWQKFTVNLRETIYGPVSQYTATSNPVLLSIGTTGITDLSIGYNFTSWARLDVGANNLFNIIPPLVPTGSNGKPVDGGRVFNVPLGISPWGQNGGYWYGRITLNF
jgi:iron complex outermembrane receptor protein